MKRIKPEELPKELPDELIYILAEMAEEMPVSQEWKDCSKKLTDDQKFKVYETRSLVRENHKKEYLNSLTKEERKEEERKSDEWFKKAQEGNGFYGNMSRPEYPGKTNFE